MTTLWDTTGSDVVRTLAAERRNGGVASGLALTLVVVTEERHVPDVHDAVMVAAAAHPARLLVVTRSPGQPSKSPDRLDAEIVVGGPVGGCEAVVMRMQGRLALHAESVVVPLLAPDVPVVTWWHGPPPDRISTDPLGVVAERRITDATQADDPVTALHRRAVDYAAGDTDLCWTRLTGWRTLLAGALDGIADGGRVATAEVSAPARDASASLLAGWLQAQLGVTPTRRDADALAAVRLVLSDDREIRLSRRDGGALLERTGQEPRPLPLLARTFGELLAEELRRLDADQSYAAALSAATGVPNLSERPSARVHTWVDPELTPESAGAAR